MSIQYIVEVAVPGARVEHRFEGYEDAKRYAADVLALNPGVEVHLYQQEGGWLMEIRRDVWGSPFKKPKKAECPCEDEEGRE